MDIRLLGFRRSALEEEDVVISVVLPEIEMHERQDIDVGELRVEENV